MMQCSSLVNSIACNMNHFDDRASYFAWLRDQGRLIACLDANQQADRSLLTYGGQPAGRAVMLSDMQQDA